MSELNLDIHASVSHITHILTVHKHVRSHIAVCARSHKHTHTTQNAILCMCVCVCVSVHTAMCERVCVYESVHMYMHACV